MPNKIIEITQYGIARIRKDQSIVEGIYTKDLVVCLGIILKSPKYLLLIHADANFDTDYIAKHCAWISHQNQSYSLTIAYNKQQHRMTAVAALPFELTVAGFVKRLQASLEQAKINAWSDITYLDVPAGELIVLTNGEIKTAFFDITERVPDFELRKAINFLNYLSKQDDLKSDYANLELDLQYNLDHWTERPVLLPLMQELIKIYETFSNWQLFVAGAQQRNIISTSFANFLNQQQPVIEKQMRYYIDHFAKKPVKEIDPNAAKIPPKEASPFLGMKKGFLSPAASQNNSRAFHKE